MFDKEHILSTLFFGLVVVIAVTVAVLYFANILRWGNSPDFGFGFRTATGIDVIGLVNDHGVKAGLREGDRILRVNGKGFATLQEFRAAMHRNLGEENTYLLHRDEGEVSVKVVNVPVGFKAAFLRSGFLYLVGLCYVLIGVLVFLMKPHHETGWVFLLVTAAFGLFMACLYKVGTMAPPWLETFHIFVYTLAPATLFHLALSFPQESRLLKAYPKLQAIPYVITLFLFLRIRALSPSINDTPRPWLLALVAYLASAVVFFLGSCVTRWLTSPSAMGKLRAKVILLGFALSATIPLADLVSSAFFRAYILPSFNLYVPLFIFFPLSIGYAIVQHDLFDIDAVIKRTYGYLLTTLGVAVTYGMFVLLSDVALGALNAAKSRVFPMIFTLAVVFLFNPVRNRLQKVVDRVFYRLEYNEQDTVRRISETMRSLLTLDEILRAMLDLAMGVMFIDAGRVMLLSREKTAYECMAVKGRRENRRKPIGAAVPEKNDGSVGAPAMKELDGGSCRGKNPGTPAPAMQDVGSGTLKLAPDAALIKKLAAKKKEVTIYDLEADPLFDDVKEECAEVFERLQATLIIPLIYEERLTGFIALGEKKSGRFYRREDVHLLTILANQGAVALENARLLEEVIEKERMEEELAIARDLQMSMLPTACPRLRDFQIAAASIPAREVGGDFFDFIEMGNGRLGVVIGDVTGKSVSGALVVSASRSVFRMLSEEGLSVGEIMGRANGRLRKDLKKGMFVALLYAVLDERDRSLSLCSAGQTQPVYLKAKTGEATLVETDGDSFPLGIFPEADYRETRLDLEAGDRVVFYTDGIVEAMNERQEIFGFDRLLDLIARTRSSNSESLLREILEEVHEFAGAAPQHDDLTVITVGFAMQEGDGAETLNAEEKASGNS